MLRVLALALCLVCINASTCLDYCASSNECIETACGDQVCACSSRGVKIEQGSCICDQGYGGLDCSKRFNATDCSAGSINTPRYGSKFGADVSRLDVYDSRLYLDTATCNAANGAIKEGERHINDVWPSRMYYAPEIGPFRLRVVSYASAFFRSNSSDPDKAFTFHMSGDTSNPDENARAFPFMLRPTHPLRPNDFTLHDALTPTRTVCANGSLTRSYVEQPTVWRLYGDFMANSFRLRSTETGEWLAVSEDDDSTLVSSSDSPADLKMTFFEASLHGTTGLLDVMHGVYYSPVHEPQFRILTVQGVRHAAACLSHCFRETLCTTVSHNNDTLVCVLFNSTSGFTTPHANTTIYVRDTMTYAPCPLLRYQPDCTRQRLSFGPLHLTVVGAPTQGLFVSNTDGSLKVTTYGAVGQTQWILQSTSQDTSEFYITTQEGGVLTVDPVTKLLSLGVFNGIFSQTWIAQEFCSPTSRCSIGFGHSVAFCSAWYPSLCLKRTTGGLLAVTTARKDDGDWVGETGFSTAVAQGVIQPSMHVSSSTTLTVVGDSFGGTRTHLQLECMSLCMAREDCLGWTMVDGQRGCYIIEDVYVFVTAAIAGRSTWLRTPVVSYSLGNHQWARIASNNGGGVTNNAQELCLNSGVLIAEDDRLNTAPFFEAPHSMNFDERYIAPDCTAPVIGPVSISNQDQTLALNDSYFRNVSVSSNDGLFVDYWMLRPVHTTAVYATTNNFFSIYSALNGIYSLDVDWITKRLTLRNRVERPHRWHLHPTALGATPSQHVLPTDVYGYTIESADVPGYVIVINSTGAWVDNRFGIMSVLRLAIPYLGAANFDNTHWISSADVVLVQTSTDAQVGVLQCVSACMTHKRCFASTFEIGDKTCNLILGTQTGYGGSTIPLFGFRKPAGVTCYIPTLDSVCQLPSLGAVFFNTGEGTLTIGELQLFHVVAVQQREVRLIANDIDVMGIVARVRSNFMVWVNSEGQYELEDVSQPRDWSDGEFGFLMGDFSRDNQVFRSLLVDGGVMGLEGTEETLASFASLVVVLVPEYQVSGGPDTTTPVERITFGHCFDEDAVDGPTGAVIHAGYAPHPHACQARCLATIACLGMQFSIEERTCTTFFVLRRSTLCNHYWLWTRSTYYDDDEDSIAKLIPNLPSQITAHPFGLLQRVIANDDPEGNAIEGSRHEVWLVFQGISGNNGKTAVSGGDASFDNLFEVNTFNERRFNSAQCPTVPEDCPQDIIYSLNSIEDRDSIVAVGYGEKDAGFADSFASDTVQFFASAIVATDSLGEGQRKFVRLITGFASINSEISLSMDEEDGMRVWCGWNMDPVDVFEAESIYPAQPELIEELQSNQATIGWLLPVADVDPRACWYELL